MRKAATSFSKYFDTLDTPAKKKRYCEKLKLIDDIDLYAIEDENFTYDINCFPTITYPDIVNYLVLERWVIDVKTLVTKSDLNIVRGKVMSLRYSILFCHFS